MLLRLIQCLTKNRPHRRNVSRSTRSRLERSNPTAALLRVAGWISSITGYITGGYEVPIYLCDASGRILFINPRPG